MTNAIIKLASSGFGYFDGLSQPFSPPNMGPLQNEAVNAYRNYTPNIIERMFEKLKEKKKEKLRQAIQSAKQQDQADYEEWKVLTELAENVLEGNPKAFEKVIFERNDFQPNQASGFRFKVLSTKAVEVEFQVKLDEVVPTETLTLTKTGKVSKRTMGKTRFFQIAKDHVCSQALWTARFVFAYLPVAQCLVHITENKVNTATGNMENRVLLSALFDKHTFKKMNFQQINPSDAMENFKHHMNHLKTKGFRAVKRVSEW